MSYKVCVIWVLIDLHIFSCVAVVKRDVADSLGDQINEKFDELDVSAHVSRVSPVLHHIYLQDTKYCIEGSNCMDLIQWCDKRKFKVC